MKGISKKAKDIMFQLWILKFRFVKGKLNIAKGVQIFTFAFLLFTCAFCFPDFVSAQDDDIVPPPLKNLTNEEKTQLGAEQNVKKHTLLALNLMEARLRNAEMLTNENNYSEALNTLGGFHALLDNTLNFLVKNDTESDRVQYNFKKFELALRGQTPRLEVIRRGMPSRFGYYVQKLIKAVRAARTKAIEPLFDDSVVPERKP